MILDNARYDEIRREYDMTQLQNRNILEDRIREVCNKFPEYKECDNTIAEYSVMAARELLSGNIEESVRLKKKISFLKERKKSIIRDAGLPEDYLEAVYTCRDCKDTGYIDGKKCHCFNQKVINTVYEQSNIKNILERENFEKFSFDVFSEEDTDKNTGTTALENAKHAYNVCRNFVECFDEEFKNILFFGTTGTGKTFLSNCIAKELMDSGHSVIYFTAFQLFDILAKGVFDKEEKALEAHKNIFTCDLLIIDDLGTEMVNSFTASQLFLCINERILRKKSTIISTNLTLSQISRVYSERVLSRILNSYSILKMHGQDIRLRRK